MAKQTMSYAAMQKSRADGVAMLQKMTMRPVINVPNARARLGASDYEKCVSQSSARATSTSSKTATRFARTSSSTRPVKSTPR